MIARALPVLSVLLVLPASIAPAQGTRPDASRAIGDAIERQLLLEVESRLASADLATIAWGGWLAARHRVATAVPKLEQTLASLPEGPHRRFAALSLLDALQVNGATPSRAALAGFETGMHEVVAYVLLARGEKPDRDFFREQFARHDQNGRASRWLASGHVLARCRDREFARMLVASLRYELDVVVVDGDAAGGVGGGAGGRFGDGRIVVPRGFPPLAVYRLVTRPEAGDVLFAAGEPAVHYRREVRRERDIGIGGAEPLWTRRQQQRVRWIGGMLDRSGLELPRRHDAWIAWRGPEPFVAEVHEARDALVRRHDELVALAVSRGWFTADERAGLAARVEIDVHDRRADRSVALPEIE